MKAAYVAPYTAGGLARLKTALLYFDKLTVQDRTILEIEDVSRNSDGRILGKVVGVHSIVGDFFRGETALLVNESVLDVLPAVTDFEQAAVREYASKTELARNSIMEIDGKSVRFVESDDQVELIERFQGPMEVGSYINFGFLYTYYSGLLADTAQWAKNGVPVVSGSESLYKVVQSAMAEGLLESEHMKELQRHVATPLLMSEIVNEVIVDVSSLEFEDILEARRRFNSEFVELQEALDRISFELSHKYEADEILREGRRIASAAVGDPIKKIEAAMRGSKYGSMKSLYQVLRKPDAYVPLIASAVTPLPLELALLVSAGVMMVETAVEYITSRREIMADPLYFLVRQRELAAKRALQKPMHTDFACDVPRRSENRMTRYVWPEHAVKVLRGNK